MWRVSGGNLHSSCSFVRYAGTTIFNRSRELDALSSTLKDAPQFSIISGPVNSGKSTVLGEVMKMAKEDTDPSIVHIDLRTRTFRDTSSFASALIDELGLWYKWLKKLKPLFRGEVKGKVDVSNMDPDIASRLELTFGISKGENSTESPRESSERLKNAFDVLSKALPDWSWLRGYGIPSPVLVIDEANRLRALLEDQRGNATLNDFFSWIIRNTKQDNRFHVMMASSDSFFNRWVTQYVDPAYFRNFVIGHLSKEEAKKFWDKKVVMRHRHDDIPPLNFEKVYEICGGCIHLISETDRIHRVTRGIVEPHTMSYVSLRRAKFIKMLSQSDLPWKPNDLFTIMQLLVKHGYVGYNTLCNKANFSHGQKTVDAMIEHNVVHLRPCAIFPFDVEALSSEYPIITPHLPCDVLIMKELLRQHHNNNPVTSTQ